MPTTPCHNMQTSMPNNSYEMSSINGHLQESIDHVAVLMVPFPLQGHLNQLLHLSRLVSNHKIQVHYVGTAAQNSQARQRIHGWDPQTSNITFHELPSLPYQSPPPDPNAPIKFPSHLQPLFETSVSSLREPVDHLLSRLCATNRRVVIIHDSLMGSVVQDFVKYPNAESYIFHSVSAFAMFFYLWENLGRPFAVDEDLLKDLPSSEGGFTPEFTRLLRKQHEYLSLSSGRVYNTSRVLESQFLDLLAKPEITGNKKQWALGPFNPVILEKKKELSSDGSRHKCLRWLDEQARDSVIFVSFGTSTTFTNEQIKELAIGLERSRQKFIWALRYADCGDVINGEVKRIKLPKGFEERVRGRGLVVRDWAPQLEILGHYATGGFLSHCGWNSCMESISMGVPIAAWPMHSDQPRNTVLMTKVLKIGLVVKDWARRNEIVTSYEVEGGVRRLMASEDGAGMRKRAVELGGAVREAAGAEGGATHLELDYFVSHITR